MKIEKGIAYHQMPECMYQENNRFVKTERFSPVIYGNDLPDERDPFHVPVEEWDEKEIEQGIINGKYIVDEVWWNKQWDRCIYGYTVRFARENGDDVTITGMNYFYLNFWPIYAKKKGGINVKTLTNPRFTDVDYEIFWRIEAMKSLGKDDLFYKSRQKGFSEKGACIIGYNFTFIPYSENLIVAGNEEDSQNTMGKATRGLDYLINTQFYHERKKSASDYYIASKFGSKIKQLTAGSNGMQSVSRFTPYWIMYEEIGKWPKGLVRAMREFVDVSLMNEGVKTGYAMYIGTGGDMDTGAADMELMYYNPDQFNLLEFEDILELEHMKKKEGYVAGFIPSWKYAKIDNDGNSLRNESFKFHEEEGKKRKKEAAILYSVNNPLYPHQGFMVPSGGYFGEVKQAKLVERKAIILTNRKEQIVEEGNLYWKVKDDWNSGVYFEPGPDKNGKTTAVITERPKINELTGEPYENLYKQGTDSYDRDEANASTSLGSSIVGHGFLDYDSPSNYPVARLTIRPETWEGGAEKFFEEVLKMNIYYNAINLVEYSNLRIFDFYKNHGFNHLLKERPKLMIAKWIQDSKVANDFGIDPNTKHHWLAELSDQMTEEWINNIYDIGILSALAKFRYTPGRGRYNCDITISMALLAVLYQDEIELEVITEQQEQRYQGPGIKFKRSGNAFKVM